ncbi:MAG: hypothetical protein ACE5GJ_08465 [Gemmatimonadota bacterium]
MFRTPPAHSSRARAAVFAAAVTLLLLGMGACGDDPFTIKWEAAPDTVLLYSLARPELNLNSGFNLNRRTPVRVEAPDATGKWDFAVDTRDGVIVLLPPGALGVESRAGIAVFPGATFDEVTEAPADTTRYERFNPVPVSLGNIYVVRTNQGIGAFGTRCVYYGKLEPLDVDPEGGTLTFVYDSSPVCNDRRLIPPK